MRFVYITILHNYKFTLNHFLQHFFMLFRELYCYMIIRMLIVNNEPDKVEASIINQFMKK